MSLLLFSLLAQTAVAVPTSKPVFARPFQVGEAFIFKGRFTALGLIPVSAGNTTLTVVGIESTRGVETWKFSMVTDIKTKLFSAHSELTSWTGTADFISRRFLKFSTDSGRNPGTQDFKIYPDSGFYRRNLDSSTKPIPRDPLDDLSFLYYVRMIPLKVGDSFSIPRYYRPQAGPLKVSVSGREKCELPDGTRPWCLVLHPVVEEKNGMFRAEAQAKLWLTDDARRIPVRIESSITGGKVRLQLDRMTLGTGLNRE